MAKYRSSQLAKKKKNELYLKGILFLVVIISTIFLVSEFSKIDFISIKEIKIIGNDVVESDVLKHIVLDEVSSKYFWLFSKENILIYPKRSIKNYILQNLPVIKEVNLNLDLPNILEVRVKERKPYALWCITFNSSSEELNNNNNSNLLDVSNQNEDCYFMDEKGYIYDNFLSLSGNNYFKYYTNLNSKDKSNIIKQSILDFEKFKEIDFFVQFIYGLDLKPYELRVKDFGNYRIYFGDGSYLIFDKDQNIRNIMDNLQSVLNSEDFLDKSLLNKIDYIDLRFDNKVFYKMR